VASFILDDQVEAIAGSLARRASTADNLREVLALTIAVVTIVERTYKAMSDRYPDHWESLEQSAHTFVDHFVVEHFADSDPEVQRALAKHRERRVEKRAGKLGLVESERDQRTRWAVSSFPEGTPMPISEEVAEGLNELTLDVRDRITQHLNEASLTDPMVFAGQVVGLLSATEFCSRCCLRVWRHSACTWPRSAQALRIDYGAATVIAVLRIHSRAPCNRSSLVGAPRVTRVGASMTA
jgi:hypothetical protein